MLKTRNACGFTLVELMIGLAIVAILMFSAIPSYTAWMQNTKIRNAADAVLNGLQLARAEAIQRNTNVQFVVAADSGWSVSVVAPAQVVQTRTAGQGSAGVIATMTPGAATTVTFNALGRVVANADGSASISEVTFDVSAATLPATLTRELRVTVSPAGRARMCDPGVTEPTDIRNCVS